MFFKKKSNQDKIESLSIKIAGLREREETMRTIITGNKKGTPFYFIESFVNLREKIACLEKELEILQNKN